MWLRHAPTPNPPLTDLAAVVAMPMAVGSMPSMGAIPLAVNVRAPAADTAIRRPGGWCVCCVVCVCVCGGVPFARRGRRAVDLPSTLGNSGGSLKPQMRAQHQRPEKRYTLGYSPTPGYSG